MALAVSRNVSLGAADFRAVATGSATVDIRFLPPSSDFNRALKLALGRLRKSAAMRTSGSIPAAVVRTWPSLRANIASRALFSCSIFCLPPFPECRERLGIGTLHARLQRSQGAKL